VRVGEECSDVEAERLCEVNLLISQRLVVQVLLALLHLHTSVEALEASTTSPWVAPANTACLDGKELLLATPLTGKLILILS
jgi:hypothetical protein